MKINSKNRLNASVKKKIIASSKPVQLLLNAAENSQDADEVYTVYEVLEELHGKAAAAKYALQAMDDLEIIEALVDLYHRNPSAYSNISTNKSEFFDLTEEADEEYLSEEQNNILNLVNIDEVGNALYRAFITQARIKKF